jgi:hypothetical protein
MPQVQFTPREADVIKTIATWFEKNQRFISADFAMQELKLGRDEFEPFILRLERYGAVEDIRAADGYRVAFFTPAPSIIDLAHKIEEAASPPPPDIVEQLKIRVRQNPVTAWIIILAVVTTTLVTFVNQALELWRKLFG